MDSEKTHSHGGSGVCSGTITSPGTAGRSVALQPLSQPLTCFGERSGVHMPELQPGEEGTPNSTSSPKLCTQPEARKGLHARSAALLVRQVLQTQAITEPMSVPHIHGIGYCPGLQDHTWEGGRVKSAGKAKVKTRRKYTESKHYSCPHQQPYTANQTLHWERTETFSHLKYSFLTKATCLS